MFNVTSLSVLITLFNTHESSVGPRGDNLNGHDLYSGGLPSGRVINVIGANNVYSEIFLQDI